MTAVRGGADRGGSERSGPATGGRKTSGRKTGGRETGGRETGGRETGGRKGAGVLGVYRRGVGALAATRGGARALRAVLPRLDGLVMRLSGGKYNASDHAFPTLVLTTTGRKSGQPRAQPLCYVRDGADLVVVGTNWGQERHPAWTANLLTDPHATVVVGGRRLSVTATEVTGQDWETLYRRFEAMGRNYTAYRSWSGGRTPRMFRLSPSEPV